VLVAAAIFGFVVDTALRRSGVIVLADTQIAPMWLVALWPNVAASTAPSGSLGTLSARPLLGALLGAVAAPLAYEAGSRLGAIGFDPRRLRALLTIGVVWSGVLPIFFATRSLVGEWRKRHGEPDAQSLGTKAQLTQKT
jgi:hypothetical protein